MDRSTQISTKLGTGFSWLRSIRTRLMLLVGLVLLAAVALSLRSTLGVIAERADAEARAALAQGSKSLSQSIVEESNRLAVQSRLLSSLPILRAVLDTGDVATIRDTAKDYRRELGLDVVDLYDARGRFLVGVGEASTPEDRAGIAGLVAQAARGKVASGWLKLKDRLAQVVAGPVGQGALSGVTVLGVVYDNAHLAELGLEIRGDLEAVVGEKVVASSKPGLKLQGSAEFESGTLAIQDQGPVFKLYLSKASGLLTQQTIRRTVLLQSFLILLVSIVLAAWVSGSVTRPILRLKSTAGRIIASNSLSHRAEVQGSDEVAELGRVFNHLLAEVEDRNERLEESNRTLEQKVAERTFELLQAHQDLATLLDNLDQGFLTFGLDGVVRKGSTRAATTLFGVNPTGLKFSEALNMDVAGAATMSDVLGMVEQQIMHFDDLWPLLPKVFENPEGRRVELEYRLMNDVDGKFTGLFICIASDKTEEYQFRMIAEREAAQTKMIVRALSQREAFLSALHDALQSLEVLKSNLTYYGLGHPGGLHWYRNQIHTLKGNLSSFSVQGPAKALHLLEDQLEKGQSLYDRDTLESFIHLGLTELDLEFGQIKEQFGELLGIGEQGAQPSKVIPQPQLDHIYAEMVVAAGPHSPVVEEFKAQWVLDDARVLFGHYERVVEELAPRWSKEIRCQVRPSSVRLRAQRYRPVVSAMVHLFRNAVVHGIEFPDERTLLGKLREGSITVEVTEVSDRVRFVISDDGNGINVAKLRLAAVEAGVAKEQDVSKMSDDEALGLVFLAGVSTTTEVTDTAGRGFGLSALATEVAGMGGRISVVSAPQKGTTFTIELPLHRDC